MSRRSFALAASAFLVAFVAVAAGPQDRAAAPVEDARKDEPDRKSQSPPFTRDKLFEGEEPRRDEWTTVIDKWFEAYDLKPHPLPPIPDDPPPHEGAMIDYPFVVDPPDLVLVELLEGLPGRPISGERLVRPDGTISLGFYGDLPVRGLTLSQVKVAMLKHLRKYLYDDVLGLRIDPPEDVQIPVEMLPDPAPPPGGAGKKAPDRPVAWAEKRRPRLVHPENSTRLFVDITGHNSKFYVAAGDVQVPGKLSWTGNETVLDALQYAGGLIHIAEPKDIRLVRPGLGGKPPRVYMVDLAAIQERGDVRTNYQIFPGDRLFVGRNDIVKKTIEIDRLHAAIQPVVSSIQQNANMLKSLGALKPEQGDEVLRDLVDFWARELSRGEDLKFDEQKLREILLRQLKRPPAAPRPEADRRNR